MPFGEALPERGTFFRLEVYLEISRVEVLKRVGKTNMLVFKWAFQNFSKHL